MSVTQIAKQAVEELIRLEVAVLACPLHDITEIQASILNIIDMAEDEVYKKRCRKLMRKLEEADTHIYESDVNEVCIENGAIVVSTVTEVGESTILVRARDTSALTAEYVATNDPSVLKKYRVHDTKRLVLTTSYEEIIDYLHGRSEAIDLRYA